MKIISSVGYFVFLVVLIYVGGVIGRLISSFVTESHNIGYVITMVCTAAISYGYFYLTLKNWSSINHVRLTKATTIIFGLLVVVATSLGSITGVLMKRSAEYSSSEILTTLTPWFTIVALFIGPLVTSVIFHNRAKKC